MAVPWVGGVKASKRRALSAPAVVRSTLARDGGASGHHSFK